jgi:hypothetical protein
MTAARALALVRDHDDARSLAARFRQARWQRFAAAFPDAARYDVLDLGGTSRFWSQAPVQPRSVTVVNLPSDDPALPPAEPWIDLVEGDATGGLAGLGARRFDLVFSNSVIEHVGGYTARKAFADNVRRLGDRFWVQTPNRYFPIEPHWLFPGFQFLPLPAQSWVSCRWPFGYTSSPDRETGVEDALGVQLIGATELRCLFPGATIAAERIGGMAKSLIAWR